jgi:hypothetical protein
MHGWWVGGGERDCRGSPLGWVAGDVTPKISRRKASEKVQRNRMDGDIIKKYSIYIDLSRQ